MFIKICLDHLRSFKKEIESRRKIPIQISKSGVVSQFKIICSYLFKYVSENIGFSFVDLWNCFWNVKFWSSFTTTEVAIKQTELMLRQ